MKKLTVEVCVCTSCMLEGAMHIAEAAESLKKLRTHLRMTLQPDIVLSSGIEKNRHPEQAPLVRINGELMKCAHSEEVMEKILELSTKKKSGK